MPNVTTLPTGYLFTDTYSRGDLETLSIGDYGKAHNIKADFLGYTKPIHGVENAPCKPLSDKWVVTLSTQYGCAMNCKFCDVPNIKFRGNATTHDLYDQLISALSMFPDVNYTERLNIHFARMGEPIMNSAVFKFAEYLYRDKASLPIRVETLHPVLTTSMPKCFKNVSARLHDWCRIKNEVYNGQAGLQLSINSTCDEQRHDMFNGGSLSLSEISTICSSLPPPTSRKYCLNFALADGYEVDAKKLSYLFDPEQFMVKITPIHNNSACTANNIVTSDGYSDFTPYEKAEVDLKAEGFDVLIFVPSMDEEKGLVTCGNAVLGGGKVKSSVLTPWIEQ